MAQHFLDTTEGRLQLGAAHLRANFSRNPRAAVARALKQWVCPVCLVFNKPDRTHCFGCREQRPANQPPLQSSDPTHVLWLQGAPHAARVPDMMAAIASPDCASVIPVKGAQV